MLACKVKPMRASFVFVVFFCGVLSPFALAKKNKNVPTADLSRWAVEQVPGGSVKVKGNALEIKDKAGCTVWWKEKLEAPVAISFTVTVVYHGKPGERVSDVNCFWMANETHSNEAPFAKGNGRSGKFSEYDSLKTYYVGYGANNNTTTRFRRYDGTSERPMLPEHDLSDRKLLLEPNRPYRMKVVAEDGVAEFWRDGERIFIFTDPFPPRTGWFGFRTVHSHLLIEDFEVDTSP